MTAKKLIFITFLTILLLILWRIAGWTIISNTKLWHTVISDEFHHYHIGFGLLIIAFLIRKKLPEIKDYFLAIGAGLIIDEWIYVFKFINPEVFSHFHATFTPIKFLVGLLAELLGLCVFSLFVIKLKTNKFKDRNSLTEISV